MIMSSVMIYWLHCTMGAVYNWITEVLTSDLGTVMKRQSYLQGLWFKEGLGPCHLRATFGVWCGNVIRQCRWG